MSRNLYARPRAILPYNSNPPPSVSQSDGRRFIVQSNPGVLLMPFWDDEAILTYGPSDTLVSLNINFPSNRSDEHGFADERKLNATQTQLWNIDKQTRTDREIWTKWFTDCPYLPKHLMPRPRPLRLLSLDGGGVRGIVSLIMLQRIMDRIAPGCKPCEYFDLIGGTSTGGLIAMMLGRLRMTTAECIVAYKRLAKEVFDVYPMKQWLTMLHAHRFSGKILQNVVKEIVKEHLGSPSAIMCDDQYSRWPFSRSCRTFVVAIPGFNVRRGVKLFRSYHNPYVKQSADFCAIWEAARATSCAPSYFPEIVVSGVVYGDGGLGYNNPAQLVLNEAQSLWGSRHPIGCLISLGTGKMEPVFRRLEGIGDVLAFPQKLVDIATNCEDTHKTISDQQAKLHRHHRFYFRFNPDLKSKVKLDEWKRLGELEDVTRVYLENGPACEKLRHLANRLGG